MDDGLLGPSGLNVKQIANDIRDALVTVLHRLMEAVIARGRMFKSPIALEGIAIRVSI